ncbi:hypothetical protein BKA93DRAFT_823096 [Sparassis latifolia]
MGIEQRAVRLLLLDRAQPLVSLSPDITYPSHVLPPYPFLFRQSSAPHLPLRLLPVPSISSEYCSCPSCSSPVPAPLRCPPNSPAGAFPLDPPTPIPRPIPAAQPRSRPRRFNSYRPNRRSPPPPSSSPIGLFSLPPPIPRIVFALAHRNPIHVPSTVRLPWSPRLASHRVHSPVLALLPATHVHVHHHPANAAQALPFPISRTNHSTAPGPPRMQQSDNITPAEPHPRLLDPIRLSHQLRTQKRTEQNTARIARIRHPKTRLRRLSPDRFAQID